MNPPAAGAACHAVLIGATGRMGRAILACAAEYPQLSFVAALGAAGSGALGRDAGVLAGGAPNQLLITSDLHRALPRAQVVIDFSPTDAGTRLGVFTATTSNAKQPLLSCDLSGVGL